MSHSLALTEGCVFVKEKRESWVKDGQSTLFSCQQSEDCAGLSGSLSKAALSTRHNGTFYWWELAVAAARLLDTSTLLRHEHFQTQPELLNAETLNMTIISSL